MASRRQDSINRLLSVRSEYYDIILTVGNREFRACKVQFRKQAGALSAYVHVLPAFGTSFGRVKRVELLGPAGGPEQVKFTDGGGFTTRRVKFHHPTDGRAHFSGNGVNPLFTEAPPLRRVNGQFFSLGYWSLDSFAPAKSPGTNTVPMRIPIAKSGSDPKGLAGRVVAWCFHRSAIERLGIFENVKDPTRACSFISADGQRERAVVLSPNVPTNPLDDLILIVTHRKGDIRSGLGYPIITFLGGWDISPDQRAPDAHCRCLALKYAERDEEFEDHFLGDFSMDWMGEVKNA